MRLYADFYESDIIVASPLALATKITEGEEEEGGAADMLSSIEVLLVARLDVMQMQNWAHMTTGMLPAVRHGLLHMLGVMHTSDTCYTIRFDGTDSTQDPIIACVFF